MHAAVRPGHRNAADPSDQLRINLRMFFNLVRNRECFGRFVFLSSGAVYDVRRSLRRVGEDEFDTAVPADEHGFSKYVVARCLEHMDDAVELRLFGVFGPHEDYAIRFISNAICKALLGLPITLRQNRRFSYLYAPDLAPIIESLLEAQQLSGALNVVPDEEVELLRLAQLVRARSGDAVPVQVARAGYGLDYSAGNQKLRLAVPSVIFTPPERAIDELYVWYESRRHQLDRGQLEVDR